jgi:hypothetical protein
VLALAAWSACGGPRLLVRDAPSRAIVPPSPGRARIVLAAPGAYRDVISIVDERGRYLGQLGGRTYTTIEVDPGARRFYALTRADAYVVRGEVEAGHTYFVLAETGLARPFRWLAWTPTCEEREARLREARAIEPDPSADPAAIVRQLGDVPRRVQEAEDELAAMDEAERARRVLRPAPDCSADTGADSNARSTERPRGATERSTSGAVGRSTRGGTDRSARSATGRTTRKAPGARPAEALGRFAGSARTRSTLRVELEFIDAQPIQAPFGCRWISAILSGGRRSGEGKSSSGARTSMPASRTPIFSAVRRSTAIQSSSGTEGTWWVARTVPPGAHVSRAGFKSAG